MLLAPKVVKEVWLIAAKAQAPWRGRAVGFTIAFP